MPAASRTASGSSRSASASKTRLGPSSASNRMDVDDGASDGGERLDNSDDDDDLGGVKSNRGGSGRGAAAAKKTTTGAGTRKTSGKRGAAAKDDAPALDLELDSDSDADGASTSKKTPAQMEAALRKVTAERDALAAQFAEMRALRTTEQEKDLASYKKAAESRFKHSQDLISTLRTQLDVANRKLKALGAGGVAEAEAEGAAAEELKAEVEALRKEKKKAEAESECSVTPSLAGCMRVYTDTPISPTPHPPPARPQSSASPWSSAPRPSHPAPSCHSSKRALPRVAAPSPRKRPPSAGCTRT